jgi:hypothetical protein
MSIGTSFATMSSWSLPVACARSTSFATAWCSGASANSRRTDIGLTATHSARAPSDLPSSPGAVNGIGSAWRKVTPYRLSRGGSVNPRKTPFEQKPTSKFRFYKPSGWRALKLRLDRAPTRQRGPLSPAPEVSKRSPAITTYACPGFV